MATQPVSNPPRAFIIHGRDLDAVAELSDFLVKLGLTDMKFDDVADRLGANPFIADIVVRGISMADVVVGFFTPDEIAALYDSDGRYMGGTARWQARPNVLFEAGVAWGLAHDKVILATLGADVELFSDVQGVHILRLDQERGRRSFIARIEHILGRPLDMGVAREAARFMQVTRKRRPYYDEIDCLMHEMENIFVGSGRIALLNVLRRAVRNCPAARIARMSADDLMVLIATSYRYPVANESYWWMIVAGVLRFRDIDAWFEDDGLNYRYSVAYAEISERGRALIRSLIQGKL
jgi:hypothetical protein